MPNIDKLSDLNTEYGYEVAAVIRGAIGLLSSTEDVEEHDQIMDAIRLLDVALQRCDSLIDRIDAFTTRHNPYQCEPRGRPA